MPAEATPSVSPMVATDLGVRAGPGVAPAPPEAGPAGRSGFRGSFLFWPVVVYVAARGLTLAALGITDLVTHDSFVSQVYRWDGKWFVHAAQNGYPRHLPMVHGHVAGNTIAFFPLYPGLIRWISHLTTVSPLVVAAVISAVTGLSATVAIGLLVRHWAGAGAATRASLLFAVCPGTFAFTLMYSEGIAITCIALGLLALLRKRWWVAGLLGLAATATTPIALAFVASCVWCAVAAIRKRREWRALLAPVLASLGFGAYMLWLWAHTGQFNAWRLTERGGWSSYPSLVYPLHILATFLFDPIRPTETGQLLFAGTVVAVVGAFLAVRQRQPAPVLLYGLAAAALAAVAAPVGLRPRFIMLAFPLVVAFGTRFHGRAYAVVVALSVTGLVLMTWLELFSMAVFP